MIRARTLLAFFTLLALPGIASAQRRIYGTLTCSNSAADEHRAPVAAKTGHVLTTMKQDCYWPEPMGLGEVQTRDAQDTFQSDVQGSHSDDTGSYLIHMVNGDQVTMKFTGTSAIDPSGETRALSGTWTFADGTGTLKGITGSGTYAGLPRAAGGLTYDFEGTYQLPSDIVAPPPLQPTPTQQMNPPSASDPK